MASEAAAPVAPVGSTVAASDPVMAGAPPTAAATLPPPPVAAIAVAQGGVGYAGFWLRLVAIIIDAVLLSIVSNVLVGIIAAITGLSVGLGHRIQRPESIIPFVFGGFLALAFSVSLVLNWLYHALLESSPWQATVGKKTLGLYVTDLYGRRISFARATGRHFGKFISAFILFIGFLMAGFTARKQALHDMMAGCLVLRKL